MNKQMGTSRPRQKREQLPVHPQLLEMALNQRGENFSTVAARMGFCNKYLSRKVREDRAINKYDVSFLEAVYGIPYEEYKPTELLNAKDSKSDNLSDSPAEIKDIKVEIDYEKLADVIYKAVYSASYEACTKAWENS